jgi:hypothetical protein
VVSVTTSPLSDARKMLATKSAPTTTSAPSIVTVLRIVFPGQPGSPSR